ncbi:MAG: enoyl-CoA hydratase/isomerase family protein [Gammaproteobacteria bacterium]|nr:enoyl-CoA hydratase/isomerase family protein [Gammaproteobacteria bacterium]
MHLKAFEFEIEQGVACIRINQPEIGNPINTAFCQEFNELSIECGENPDIRCVFIEAAGKNFGLGGDLKEFAAGLDQLPRKFKRMTADLHMAVARFARNDAPVVIATQGLVVGGAVALAAAGDFVYGSPESKYYAAFAGIAVCGDTGISHFLPRRVGSRRATEFLLLNQTWSAERAAEVGLINGVVEKEQLRDHCYSLAVTLANGPTTVYGQMRRALLTSYDQPLETQLEMEALGMVACAHSDNTRAAIEKLLQR